MATPLKGVDVHSKVLSKKPSMISQIHPNSRTNYLRHLTVMENTVTCTQNKIFIIFEETPRVVHIRKKRYIRSKRDCLSCKCRERKRKQRKRIEKIPP